MTKRTVTNFVVDAVAFAALALLAATGMVERYVLPAGTGHSLSLWAMTRHQWGEVHFWIAVVLLGALALHIVLHWNWIVCVVRGRRPEESGKRVALGVFGVVGLAALTAVPFLSPVERIGNQTSGQRINAHESNHGGESTALFPGEIRGSMTLTEMEKATGVSAAALLDALRLPADAPRDESLGRMRRQFAFEMDELRRAAAEIAAARPNRRVGGDHAPR